MSSDCEDRNEFMLACSNNVRFASCFVNSLIAESKLRIDAEILIDVDVVVTVEVIVDVDDELIMRAADSLRSSYPSVAHSLL